MIVLNTYEDLRKAYEELSPLLNKRREGHAGIPTPHKRELLVCGGTGCHSSESLEQIGRAHV